MKTLFALAVLSLAPTFAQAAPLVCSKGNLGEDNRIEVTIDENSAHPVVISQHELFLMADAADLVKRGNSIAIVDRKVEAFAEGEEWAGTLNALLVYHPAKKNLNLTMILDGFMHVAGAELKCKTGR